MKKILRQVYITLSEAIIYERQFGRSIRDENFPNLFPDIKRDLASVSGKDFGMFNYFRYRISFIEEKNINLIIVFITGLSDDDDKINRS